jgi:hypothetical protein
MRVSGLAAEEDALARLTGEDAEQKTPPREQEAAFL